METIRESWQPFNPSLPESPPIKFNIDLKWAKQANIKWFKEKRKKEERLAKLDLYYRTEG
jgi:hypothetical protein